MTIDYKNKPEETLEQLLTKFKDIYLIMDDVLSSSKAWKYIYQNMLDIMKLGFEIKEVRNFPIHFKFHESDKEILELPLNNFMSNLILWFGFLDMDKAEVLDKSYIFDMSNFNTNNLIDYANEKILSIHEGDFYSKNKCFDEIWHHIKSVSKAFGLLMGMGISIYDIIQTEKACPEITELIFGEIDKNMQISELEAELKRRTERLMYLFTTVSCDLKPLIVVGKNIKDGQFKEIFLSVGFKSDINGRTVPVFIDSNILISGLKKPSHIYIEAMAGRKNLILTKKSMSTPGAFSKKVNNLATSASYLRKDYEVCNTDVTVSYIIRNDLYLKMLDMRYYYDEDGNLQQLDYNRDKDLIGKIVNFRSPCTCNSKDGICHICYGGLFEVNKDLFSVGSYAATKGSEPLGQMVLSSKHEQNTDSDSLQFNEDFDKSFAISSSEILLKDNETVDMSLSIVFDKVEIEDNDDEEIYYVNSFKLVDTAGKTIYNINEENGVPLYLSSRLTDIYRKMKDKTKPISLEIFDNDDEDPVLFYAEIKSKELTDPIKIIEKVLNRKDRGAEDLSEVCQMVVDGFMEVNNIIPFVHLEAIIKGLIRKKSNELQTPDWSRMGNHKDYQILHINAGLMKNQSPLVSMSYGYLKKQLVMAELYEKNGASHLDTLFVPDLYKYID